MFTIYIDGDACPVKQETFRVAKRYDLEVFVVVNRPIKLPTADKVHLVVVPGGFDVADDWIAGHAGSGDIVVTADIPLAARCLKVGAHVLGPKGREFTEDGIGEALATRTVMDLHRQLGEVTFGPAAMDNRSRSRFLSTLDELVNRILKEQRDSPLRT
jgi:uncharacterized protein YaiI (UPF0178 family)